MAQARKEVRRLATLYGDKCHQLRGPQVAFLNSDPAADRREALRALELLCCRAGANERYKFLTEVRLGPGFIAQGFLHLHPSGGDCFECVSKLLCCRAAVACELIGGHSQHCRNECAAL